MKIKLKEVRLSFPDLHEAVQYQGAGKFRYNATFLIVPGSDNDKIVRKAIEEVAAEKFQKKAAARLEEWKSNSNKMCYVSGDLKDYEGYEGMMALSSHRGKDKGPPAVLNRDRSPALPGSGKPYAGCFVNASVEIYAQTGENAGIRCGLVGVQFVKDGDAFTGGGPASPDDFDDLGVDEDGDASEMV